MACKARGYGLTAELEKKKAGKFDKDMANEALEWVKAVLEYHDKDEERIKDIVQVETMEDIQTMLKDGVILCKVINVMYPGTVKRVNTNKMAFKQMENISNFLTGCESKAHCAKGDLFQTVDLYEAGNIPVVVAALYSLGRKAHDNADGCLPALGPQEATENKREFTEKQLTEGKNIIGLQMGTNKCASQAGQNFGKTRAIID